MRMLKGKKLVIFDMDGTLIDSIGIWNEVDRRLLRKLGEARVEEIDVQAQRDGMLRRFAGAENPYLLYCGALGERYGAAMDAQEIMRLRYGIASELLENEIDYKPGAVEFLQKMKAMGFRLAIASTTKRGNMEIYRTKNKNIMGKAALDETFERIYTQEDVREIKPKPEMHLRLMREMGVSAAECIMFEDSLVGVEAANAAGIEVVAVYDRYSEADQAEIRARADYWFEDFAAVLRGMEECGWN